MPFVTATPRGQNNGQVITEFIDSVGTPSVTYTYPKTQESLSVRNIGTKAITVTVGGTPQTLQPGQKWEWTVDFTSFSIVSSSGVQAFEAIADEDGSTLPSGGGTGPQGPQGIQGPQGVKGDKGDSGGGGVGALPTHLATVAAIGDSITQTGTDEANFYRRATWINVLCMKSKQRLFYLTNAAVAGRRLGEMLAGMDAEILPHAPHYCFVMGGTNDLNPALASNAGTAVARATMQANFIAILDKLVLNGITPIICTIAPRSDAAYVTEIRDTNSWNLWLIEYARANGYMLLDFHSVLTDPATGGWKTGYETDGLHPSFLGLLRMAEYALAMMDSYLPPYSPYLSHMNDDPNSLVKNGLFLRNTGAAPNVVFTDWVQEKTTADMVGEFSVASDTKAIGAKAGIFRDGLAGYINLKQTITTGWAVGDKISFAGYMETSFPVDGVNCEIRVNFIGSSGVTSLRPVAEFNTGFQDGGVWQISAPIPTGTTALEVVIEIGPGGNGVLYAGQVTLVNLTAQGAAL